MYPYNYFTDHDTLEEKRLPPIEDFFNLLTNSECPESEYAHAQRVYRELGFRTLREYALAYLSLDVYLLVDVLAEFQSLCLRWYELDGLRFLTLPSLALSAALRKTGVELELVTDPTLYLFFERMKRGGISFCARRTARSNVPGRPDYDEDRPTCHLKYLDAVRFPPGTIPPLLA